MTKKQAKLLWVDLEMTGLIPGEDKIMEVAAIATDWDFKELSRMEAIQKVDQRVIDSRMVGEFWDKYDYVKEVLVKQNALGLSTEEVQELILKFIDENFEKDELVILAGNSIHQDRKFIDIEWPAVSDRLHYRMLDVSSFKVLFAGKYGKKFAKPENHRALDDIKGSIEELKYYLKKVKI